MKQVTAAVLMHAGRLLICQRPPSDHLAGLWELPGGKVESNETPEACLERELREELGIGSAVGPCFGTSEYVYPGGAIALVAYHVTWTKGEIVASFHSDARFVDREELGRYRFAPADTPLIEKLREQWPRG